MVPIRDENVRDWPTLTVRVPQDVYDAVAKIAEETNRSLSYVGWMLIQQALQSRHAQRSLSD
jgi:predicted transcriptional regulator